ncbi:MAG: nucleotidyltransferase family protein [Alphaproteobacteria bacterium]
MDRDRAIAVLRAHEAELRAAGVSGLSIFGSVARGEADDGSDVDVLVQLQDEPGAGGFRHFERLDDLSRRLAGLLGRPVDVVAEPVAKERLRRAIGEHRAVAF